MDQMGHKIVVMIALRTFALVVALAELRQAQAAKHPIQAWLRLINT